MSTTFLKELVWGSASMDLSSDYQFLNKILGRTMKITLKCGLFQGVLQHVDSNKSILLSRGGSILIFKGIKRNNVIV